MTNNAIADLAATINDAIWEEVALADDGLLYGSDPGMWKHLFGQEVLPALKSYTPTGTPEETKAFRELHDQINTVIYEGLSPTDSILKHEVTDMFVEIAKKNSIVGKEILDGLKRFKSTDFSEALADRLKKVLPEQSSPAPKKKANFRERPGF